MVELKKSIVAGLHAIASLTAKLAMNGGGLLRKSVAVDWQPLASVIVTVYPPGASVLITDVVCAVFQR